MKLQKLTPSIQVQSRLSLCAERGNEISRSDLVWKTVLKTVARSLAFLEVFENDSEDFDLRWQNENRRRELGLIESFA